MIREARASAGLSQQALAEAAGTSQPAVARYESGRAEPRVDTLARILAACGLRLDVSAAPTRRTQVPSGPKGRLLRRHRDAVLAAARQAAVRNVRVFGSVARGEDTAESDIDLLVDVRGDAHVLDVYAFRELIVPLFGDRLDVSCPQVMQADFLIDAERDAIPL